MIFGVFSNSVNLDRIIINDNFKQVFYSDKIFITSSLDVLSININNKIIIVYGNVYSPDFKAKLEQYASGKMTLSTFANKLNGEFIIIVYDKNPENLFLIRDHFGFIPLYYYKENETIIFSTHIKLILKKLNKKLSLNKTFFLDGIIGDIKDKEFTVYNDIKIIPNASIYEFTKKELKKDVYWDIDIKEDNFLEQNECSANLKRLLINSVEKRISNKSTVSAELSGGIDSSGIVSIAALNSNIKINAFSHVLEDDMNKSYPFNDERKFSSLLATKHSNINQIYINNKDVGLFEILESTIKKLAYVNSVNYIDFTNPIIENTFKLNSDIIFSGFGGDQIVSSQGASYFKERIKKFNFRDSLEYLNQIESRLNIPKSKLILSILYEVWFDRIFHKKSNLKNEFALNLFETDFKKSLNYNKFFNLQEEPFISHNKALYNAISVNYTSSRITSCSELSLIKNIFYQHPLLDKNLIEFYFLIPSKYKTNSKQSRHLYKEALKSILIDEIRLRNNKSGSTIPTVQYLFNKDYDKILEFILLCKQKLETRIHNFDEIVNWHKVLKTRSNNKGRYKMSNYITVLKQLIFLYLYENDEL